MKRAVIYARVSTKEQDTNYSIPSQIEGAKEYARIHKMEVAGVYHEDASGQKYPRPKLELALQALEEGEADVLICHAGDRLNRHEINGFLIRKRVADAKAELHYTLSGECKLGDENKMYAMLLDLVAANEVRTINERMSRGRRYKAKSGTWIGLGAPPYGYRVVGEKRETHLEIYEEEARWVREVFNWYANEKLSVRKIVKRLSALGVERPGVSRQHAFAGAGPAQWNDATIYKMLKNTTYVGRFYSHRYSDKRTPQGRVKTERPRDEWLEITTPLIVSEELFNRAQVRLGKGKDLSFRNRKYEYLMATRLYCSLCGFKITTQPAKQGKHLYYRCRSYEWKLWDKKCALPSFKARRVDGIIWEFVKELIGHPESIKRAAEEARGQAREDHSHVYESIAALEAEIEVQDRRLKSAVKLYLDAKEDDDQRFTREIAKRNQEEINGMLIKLHHERDMLSRQVAELQVSDETIEAIEGFAEGLRAHGNLDGMNLEERRGVIEALGATAVLAFEDGQRVAYLTILLYTSRLAIDGCDESNNDDNDSMSSLNRIDNLQHLPSLTFRLIIAPAAPAA